MGSGSLYLAVLKSPKNVAKKSCWAKRYKVKVTHRSFMNPKPIRPNAVVGASGRYLLPFEQDFEEETNTTSLVVSYTPEGLVPMGDVDPIYRRDLR